jgi:hypothetical protein
MRKKLLGATAATSLLCASAAIAAASTASATVAPPLDNGCAAYVESVTRPTATSLKFSYIMECPTRHFNLTVSAGITRNGTSLGTTAKNCGAVLICRTSKTVSDPAGTQTYFTDVYGKYTELAGYEKSYATYMR